MIFFSKLRFFITIFKLVLEKEGWGGVTRRAKKRLLRFFGFGIQPITSSPTSRRLAVLVSGEPDTAGHIFRIERLAKALQTLGYECQILSASECPNRLAEGTAPPAVLWIWRCRFSSNLAALVGEAQRMGVPVFYDLDDLMFEPDLAKNGSIDAIRTGAHDANAVAILFGSIREMMLRADALTATTKPLASAMRSHFRPVFEIPNTFDEESYRNAMSALDSRVAEHDADKEIVRLGYAAGTFTHQRDFQQMAPALARILSDFPQCRLVLFRKDSESCLDVSEFPEFQNLSHQIEWREFVPLKTLPREIARFDINLAPIEMGNRYADAKSQLKYFDAGLLKVPTIASPAEPFQQAITDGVNGFLAQDQDEWVGKLRRLVCDKSLRLRLGQNAHLHSLARYGPVAKTRAVRRVLDFLQQPGPAQADAFRLLLADSRREWEPPVCSDARVVYEHGAGGAAEVAVVMPVFNYAELVETALESVKKQSLDDLELIVVDDASSDHSLSRILEWVRANSCRFRRVAVFTNISNQGLGATRNRCVAEARARYFLPLDADNKLHPGCAATLLERLACDVAAFAHPRIKQFGEAFGDMGYLPWNPALLSCINYIDAMALVDKFVWADVGGYDAERTGWEDYSFWCKLAEAGYWGLHVPEAIAYYRTHSGSMLRTFTEQKARRSQIAQQFRSKHDWLDIPGY